MKYKKKPVIIDAWQWNGTTLADAMMFVKENGLKDLTAVIGKRNEKIGFIIQTLEGDHVATKGDYIIRGVQGEYYPCKPDIFEQTYEPLTPSPEDKDK